MERIKFKNSQRYKGIVEQVFVKDGEKVSEGQTLAVISTQVDKFEVLSHTNGIIRNVYIIEALIVTHGDIIFDIYTEKDIEQIATKKTSSISDTLKESLLSSGYIEEIPEDSEEEAEIEETEKTMRVKSIQKNIHTDLDEEQSFITREVDGEIIESVFKDKKDEEETSNTEEEQMMVFQIPQTQVTSGMDPNESKKILQERMKMAIDMESPTQALAESGIEVDGTFEEIDIDNSMKELNNDFHGIYKQPETVVHSASEAKNIETSMIPPSAIGVVTVSDSITQELQSLNALSENNILEDEKDLEIFKPNNAEISETAELENAVENNISGNSFLNVFSSGTEVSQEETNNAVEDKIEIVEEEITEEVNSAMIYDDDLKEMTDFDVETIIEKDLEINEGHDMSGAIEQIKREMQENSDKIWSKIKNNSNLIQELASNKRYVDASGNEVTVSSASSLTYDVNVTALLNLQTIMESAFQSRNADLTLSVFLVKALKNTLKSNNIFTSKDDLICLGKIQNGELDYLDVNIEADSSLLDTSKAILSASKLDVRKEITLIDFSDASVHNSNISIINDEVVIISVGTPETTQVETGVEAKVKVTLTWKEELVDLKTAMKFSKEFVAILENPGFLV